MSSSRTYMFTEEELLRVMAEHIQRQDGTQLGDGAVSLIVAKTTVQGGPVKFDIGLQWEPKEQLLSNAPTMDPIMFHGVPFQPTREGWVHEETGVRLVMNGPIGWGAIDTDGVTLLRCGFQSAEAVVERLIRLGKLG